MKHIWVKKNRTIPWEHCSTCGVVRRRDGKNKPCRGPVKVALREKE